MIVDVFNQQNKKVETADLPDKIFKVKWNPDLVHQVLRVYLANHRQVLANTKDRAEVRGGGKKPWRQKGTGRARHGSIRSPLWIGGGVTFGPSKERKFDRKITQKMKHSAIFSVLAKKMNDGEIKLIDNLKLENHKTGNLARMLKKFVSSEKINFLLIPGKENKEINLAGRNLANSGILSPESLNIYDLLKYKNILIDKEAIGIIEKHYK